MVLQVEVIDLTLEDDVPPSGSVAGMANTPVAPSGKVGEQSDDMCGLGVQPCGS